MVQKHELVTGKKAPEPEIGPDGMPVHRDEPQTSQTSGGGRSGGRVTKTEVVGK